MKNRIWGWLVRVLAFGYPLALLVVILCFRLVGERWWVSAVALYLPRLGFALPLPVTVLVLLVFGPRRLLLTQGVAVALLIFPLMGFRVWGSATPTADSVHLRVVSYNVDSGNFGTDAIVSQLRAANADIIVLQEVKDIQRDALAAGLAGMGYSVHARGQFWTASRFPIEEVFEPAKILHYGVARSPRFIRYRLATPGGSVHVYNVHPLSPREGLDELRGEGLRNEVTSGRLFKATAAPKVVANTALRVAQVQAISEDAGRSPYPVIIAGDTNLPVASWALGHWLGGYRDGFADVGVGFGYTFPAPRHPWMRIDRIMASPPLRFVRFAVAPDHTSDHFAVSADIELPGKPQI